MVDKISDTSRVTPVSEGNFPHDPPERPRSGYERLQTDATPADRLAGGQAARLSDAPGGSAIDRMQVDPRAQAMIDDANRRFDSRQASSHTQTGATPQTAARPSSSAGTIAATTADAVPERSLMRRVLGAVGGLARRTPVIGSAVTAGFVAYEVGSHLLNGHGRTAAAAAAAGGAEIVGNLAGFGVGDAAREATREGLIRVGGREYAAVEMSGLRQVGTAAVNLVTGFNKAAPGTPSQIEDVQKKMITGLGLNQFKHEGKTIDIEATLKDPQQRKLFIENIEKVAQNASDPEVKAQMEGMANTARAYGELEDKRAAMVGQPATSAQTLAHAAVFSPAQAPII